MDIGILIAVLTLVVWAVITFIVNDAPGVTHALLIAETLLMVGHFSNSCACGENVQIHHTGKPGDKRRNRLVEEKPSSRSKSVER